MELLIAFLTFFGISFSNGGSTTSAKLDWTNVDATQVAKSDQYKTYLENGGTGLFDAAGMPAVWVTVTEPKN